MLWQPFKIENGARDSHPRKRGSVARLEDISVPSPMPSASGVRTPRAASINSDIRRIKTYTIMVCLCVFGFMALGIWFFRSQHDPAGAILRMPHRFAASMRAQLTYAEISMAYRRTASSALADGLEAGATPAQGNAQSVPILMYHGVLSRPDGSDFNVTQSEFSDQMLALKKAGYRTISSEEMYAFLRGELVLPVRSVLLTFDDGRRDGYEHADPVLKALGFQATMFVISKSSFDAPGSYYITPDEIVRMQKSGRWDIEAHADAGHVPHAIDGSGTMGHFYSNKLWLSGAGRMETDAEFASRIDLDMTTVQSRLENLLQRPIETFAFPYGDFGQNGTNFPGAHIIAEQTALRHFKLSFYQEAPGIFYTANYRFASAQDAPKVFMASRILVENSWSGADLVSILSSSHARTLPYHDDFSSPFGWKSVWSAMDFQPGRLALKAAPTQTGASAILDGTRNWQNYSVRATVETPTESGMFLWVRLQDDGDKAGCNFGNGFAHVEQTLKGENRVLRGVENPALLLPAGDFTVEARVKDRTVSCFINGTLLVASDFLDPALDRGGIGFKTWMPTVGQSELIIKKVDAEEIL